MCARRKRTQQILNEEIMQANKKKALAIEKTYNDMLKDLETEKGKKFA